MHRFTLVDRFIHLLQVFHHFLHILPVYIFCGGSNLVNNTSLDLRLGEYGIDRFTKSGQTVTQKT
jgi:hypothetical protein